MIPQEAPMLKITNLHVSVEDKPILKGLNLEVQAGEVHAIMGPNGAGKSTLGHVISGREGYTVTDGTIEFLGHDVLEMDVEDRARLGIFLAFQYPVEVPGVNNLVFLREALNAQRRARGEEEVDALDFLEIVEEKAEAIGLGEKLMQRSVNHGFSGGEKKRNEIFHMSILDPKLGILDETDSGLDIDALRAVAEGVVRQRREDNAFVVITHYQRLLDHIVPDVVHVLADGKIVRTGGKELALELERDGYAFLENTA